MTNRLYTATGKLRGWITEDTSPYKRIYSATGKLLGTYNKHTDITYDGSGRMVGKGEQLTLLLES